MGDSMLCFNIESPIFFVVIGDCCLSKSNFLFKIVFKIPVRVPETIVPIENPRTSIRAIVQIAERPPK